MNATGVNANTFETGDIAVDRNTGTLYASTGRGRFYSLNLSNPSFSFNEIVASPGDDTTVGWELSYDDTGNVLYGHSVTTGDWYTIDTGSGATAPLSGISGTNYSDLGGIPTTGSAGSGGVFVYGVKAPATLPATGTFESGVTVDASSNGGITGVSSATVALSTTVTPVNDDPVIAMSPLEFVEDTPVPVTLVATDAEADNLTFTVTGDTYITVGGVSGNTLTVSFTEHFNGVGFIQVSVDDGNGGMDSESVQVTVTPVNDAPVLDAIGPKETAEDTPFSITVTASDVDNDSFPALDSVSSGDNNPEEAPNVTKGVPTPKGGNTDILTFSALGSEHITVQQTEDDQFTFTPAPDWYGAENVTVTVTDSAGATDSETFLVTVTSVNDLPILQAVGTQSTEEDTPKTLTLVATDIEDQASALVFSAVSSALEVTPSVIGDLLTLAPATNWYGQATITITVTDPDGGTDQEAIAFTVTSVNDLPTIQDPGQQTFTEKSVLPVSLVISDVETANPAINFSTSDPGLQASLSGTTLSLIADGWYGDATVTVTITDDDQGTDTVTFDVHVIPFNIEPPIHTFPGKQTVDVCPQVYTFSLAPANGNDTANPIQVSDLDSPTLTTTLEVENGILTLPQTTGLQFQDGTANGSKKIVVFGTPSDLNDALNGLAYCGDDGYFGPDVLKLSTVDHGGLTDSDQVELVIEIVAVETGVEEEDLEGQALRIATTTGKTLDTTVEPEIVIPEGNDELVKDVIFVEVAGGGKKLFVLPQIMNEQQTANPDTDGERTSVQVQYKDTDGGNLTVDVPVVIYRPRVSVTERVQGLTQLNRVTGLYEQVLTVENTMPYPMQAIRLYAEGLTEGTTLHSATGTGSGGIVDGMPYVQFNETILAQGSNEFKIELKSQSRTWDGQVNVLIELLPEPGEDPLSGELEGIDLSGDTSNLSNGVYLNFFTESGVKYFIQYRSPSASGWTTSNIPIVGDGRPAIWVDDGPPKTPSHPGSDGFPGRFYRVVVWEGDAD